MNYSRIEPATKQLLIRLSIMLQHLLTSCLATAGRLRAARRDMRARYRVSILVTYVITKTTNVRAS